MTQNKGSYEASIATIYYDIGNWHNDKWVYSPNWGVQLTPMDDSGAGADSSSPQPTAPQFDSKGRPGGLRTDAKGRRPMSERSLLGYLFVTMIVLAVMAIGGK